MHYNPFIEQMEICELYINNSRQVVLEVYFGASQKQDSKKEKFTLKLKCSSPRYKYLSEAAR